MTLEDILSEQMKSMENELAEFARMNQIKLLSADEMILEGHGSKINNYLELFIDRWDRLMESFSAY